MKPKLWLVSLVAFAWIWLVPCSVSTAQELPGDLKSIPVYQGSKILRISDSPTQSSAILSVSADRDSVAAFYKKALEENGWKRGVESQYDSGGGVMQFAKGDDIIQIALVNKKKDDIVTLLYHIVYTHRKK